jgi:hypothetical protein
MEADDMVDVLHYYFEEDLNNQTAEQAEARSETRTLVYESLYGTKYKYKTKQSLGASQYADGSKIPSDGYVSKGGEEILEPFDPSPMTRKAYVPPTEFNPDSPMPFGKTLDAPLG